MSVPHIPVLRLGKPYESLDKAQITNVRTGEPVAEISQANAAMIRRDIRRIDEARAALRAIPSADLCRMYGEAGALFMEADLPLVDGATQSAEGYIEALSGTSGL